VKKLIAGLLLFIAGGATLYFYTNKPPKEIFLIFGVGFILGLITVAVELLDRNV
jgi:hypothetical protein